MGGSAPARSQASRTDPVTVAFVVRPARTGFDGLMPATAAHVERHLSHRSGWLRAAVLGANDGIVSTAALIIGVAAGDASGAAVFTAGVAALVAGAGSMAAGEYASVSSQRDSERADIAKEREELRTTPDRELM